MQVKALFRIIAVAMLWSISNAATAQSFLGLSINYGDKLTFTPNYPSLLLRRASFTPTLVYSYQQKLPSDFALIFGGQIGVAAYQLVPVSRDTIGPTGDRFPFVYYGIFVGRLEVVPGKIFHIGERKVFIGIGGGLSYYRFFFDYSTMDVTVADQGSGYHTFSAYVEAPLSGTFTAFGKVYIKMTISRRLDLALQYSTHFKSILQGEFEFYHTQTPAAGSIKLVPQGISLMLLYRFRSRIVS